jgi:hypothetical protein
MYGPCIWRQYVAIQAWRKAQRNSPDLHPLRDQNMPPLADLIRVWPEIKCSKKVLGTAHRIVYFMESIKCMHKIKKYTRAVEYRDEVNNNKNNKHCRNTVENEHFRNSE